MAERDVAAEQACASRGIRAQPVLFYEGRQASTYKVEENGQFYGLRIDTEMRSGRLNRLVDAGHYLHRAGITVPEPLDEQVMQHVVRGKQFSSAFSRWLPHSPIAVGREDIPDIARMLRTAHDLRPAGFSPSWGGEMLHGKLERWRRLTELAQDVSGHPAADASLAFAVRQMMRRTLGQLVRYAGALQDHLGDRAFLHGDWHDNMLAFTDQQGTRRLALNDWQYHTFGPRHIDLTEAIGAVNDGRWSGDDYRTFREAYGDALPPIREIEPFGLLGKYNWLMWIGECKLRGEDVAGPVGGWDETLQDVLTNTEPTPPFRVVCRELDDGRAPRVPAPDFDVKPKTVPWQPGSL